MSGSGCAPASRSSSGRTTRAKVTNAATGLPGRPTNAAPLPALAPRITPIATGRPGLDGDAPEHQAADLLDRAAHVVGLAGRDAARGQHQIVVARRRRRSPSPARPGSSLQDAEVGHRGAEPLEQAVEQRAVGVVERRGGPRPARLDDLVAGREQRDAHAPPHLECRSGRARRRAPRPARRAAGRPAARPRLCARPRRQACGWRRP